MNYSVQLLLIGIFLKAIELVNQLISINSSFQYHELIINQLKVMLPVPKITLKKSIIIIQKQLTDFYYKPGGIGYYSAKAHFESIKFN